MKKHLFFALMISTFLISMSCGTTETVASSIADEMNSPSKQNEKQISTAEINKPEDFPISVSEENKDNETETSEKVSEEDSNLNKETENPPTPDEKEKVSEYQIFDETLIPVYDLPETESPAAQITQPQPENEGDSEKHEISETSGSKENDSLIQQINNTENELNSAAKKQDTGTEEFTAENTAAEDITTEENTITEEEISEELTPEPESEVISPSRSVSVKLNQYLDVTYPGTGWVYIGESEQTSLFNYFGRKIGTGNTTFALRAKKSGKTLLHFYKNDLLTGEYIDDYLEVNVENLKAQGRVKAPVYAEIVPAQPQRRIDRENQALEQAQPLSEEQQKQSLKEDINPVKTNEENSALKTESENKKNNKNEETQNNVSNKKDSDDIKTVIQTSDGNTDNSEAKSLNYTPVSSTTSQNLETESIQTEPSVITANEDNIIDESLLEKAKKDFESKQYSQALTEAQQYYNNANTRLDEALYLLGQIWESESEIKNIRSSIDSYESLTKLFPASKLWKQAKNRSIYLKRFYIDIR
ncbi:hypothetical protein [Treponema sp.]|uniref:hypothetical protein n=1 Tax=Treponema sp. TaxID=166 RepID=UPI003890E8A0